MSLFLAKKQEDYNQKKVRDLLRLKENKKCFDCPTKSPSFVNTTIQTFVCARCSGLVREVGHRVKAVSASKFSGAELLALKQGGNGVALKIWLSNYSTHDSPEPESDADVRAFMKQKYYENKWLDRALLQSHKEAFRTLLAKSFTEDGLPIVTKSKSKIFSGFSRIPLIADSEMNIMNDDDEEESDVQLKQQQDFAIVSPPVYNPPVYSPPAYSQPISYSIPAPTSPITPVGRESMESAYSSSSVKSSSSSQGEPQEDYVSSSRRRVKGSQRSVTSSVRDSMDSTSSSTNTPATSCAASVLTAEEIAERCRVSIDSNSVQPPKVVEEEQVVVAPKAIIEQKPTPPALQINVAEANKNFNQYQQQQQDQYGHQQQRQCQQQQQQQQQQQIRYQQKQDQYQYQEQYEQHQQRQLQQQYEQHQRHQQEQYKHQQQQRQQLKTPTLVNFGNSIQSPSSSVNGNVSASASPVVTPSTSKTLNPSNTFDSIIMELSGLKLEKTARRATYNGGILSPASISPPTPSTSTDGLKSADDSKSRPASMFDPSVFSKQVAPQQQTLPENDLYAALRGIPSPVVHVPKEESKEEVKEFTFSGDDEDEDDPWQEFCSSSSVDENEDITATPPAQVIQPMIENNVKPIIAMDIFGDLDPRAMFKRF